MEDRYENDREIQDLSIPNTGDPSQTPIFGEEYDDTEVDSEEIEEDESDELYEEEDDLSDDEEPEDAPPHKSGGRGSFVALIAMVCFFCTLLAGSFGVFIGARLGSSSLTFDAMIRRLKANTGNGLAEHTVAEVSASASRSVVTVQASLDNQTVAQVSSGVILSQESGYAYVAAVLHAVEWYPHVRVVTSDGQEYVATCIGTDWRTDLALLRIEASGLSPAVPAVLSPVMGETVVALGNPMGDMGVCASLGTVSNPQVTISVMGIQNEMIKLDCALNQGNSGGGVFNMEGELIGIVSAKVSEYNGVQAEGMGFALPVSIAYQVFDSLRTQGYVSGRPDLGLTLAAPSSPNSYTDPLTVEGYAYSHELTGGSVLLPGDILIRISPADLRFKDLAVTSGGTKRSFYDAVMALRSVLANAKEGDELDLVIRREGGAIESVTVRVHLK